MQSGTPEVGGARLVGMAPTEPISAPERERRLQQLRVRFLRRASQELAQVASNKQRAELDRVAHNLRETGAALGFLDISREAEALEGAMSAFASGEELEAMLERLREAVREDLARV